MWSLLHALTCHWDRCELIWQLLVIQTHRHSSMYVWRQAGITRKGVLIHIVLMYHILSMSYWYAFSQKKRCSVHEYLTYLLITLQSLETVLVSLSLFCTCTSVSLENEFQPVLRGASTISKSWFYPRLSLRESSTANRTREDSIQSSGSVHILDLAVSKTLSACMFII